MGVDTEGIWGDNDTSRNVGLDLCDFGPVSEKSNADVSSAQNAGDNRTNTVGSAGAEINRVWQSLGSQCPWSSGGNRALRSDHGRKRSWNRHRASNSEHSPSAGW
jgi:hypothetical protein